MRILLVDPSQTVLKLVSRLLEDAGHHVSAFTLVPDALACLEQDTGIDALLTSVELAGDTCGMELCWRARLIVGDHRPLYIIVMSSNRDRSHLVEALDSGADDFMGKPPVPEELRARLRAAARLVSMQRDLIRLASTDPLTGALNRRAFFRACSEACDRQKDAGLLSAIMMDIDHFKSINDLHGHDTGDAVLRGVAEAAAQCEGAVLGRLGGEEFALVLEGADLADAASAAERLRARIAALSFPTAKGPIRVTSSFGVATRGADDSIDAVLKRADLSLYEAKSGGRNRVVACSDTGPVDNPRPGGVIRSDARLNPVEAAE